MSLEAKRTLVYAILKFLKDELKEETISADFKESLEGLYFYFVYLLLNDL